MLKNLLLLVFFLHFAFATEVNISPFSLNDFSQYVDFWINPSVNDYKEPLVPYNLQLMQYDKLINIYYGKHSVWNKEYFYKLFKNDKKYFYNLELNTLNMFDNRNLTKEQIGYGMNYNPYNPNWINHISRNIDINALKYFSFNHKNRGIVIANTYARALPTDDPFFLNYSYSGEGYPFDKLQISAINPNTPVYIITYSVDKKWILVLTSDFIAWVHANAVAKTNWNFINKYRSLMSQKMVSVLKNNYSILDKYNNYLYSSYLGTLFPLKNVNKGYAYIYAVTKNDKNEAQFTVSKIKKDLVLMLPLVLNKQNFAMILSEMIGRTYGWGGVNFYNDCSSELKAIFSIFGYYLPRNSSLQKVSSRYIDISKLTLNERYNYIFMHAIPFLTLIYIPHHIMLYLGSYKKGKDIILLTYQNRWAVVDKEDSLRAVIGRSVLFPLLKSFKEGVDYRSQLDYSELVLTYIDFNFSVN